MFSGTSRNAVSDWSCTRKNYYNSLDIKNITDNKQFWKTIKPFLSEKIKTTSKIKFKDQNKIISNDDKVAEEFSTFFENAVKSLKGTYH